MSDVTVKRNGIGQRNWIDKYFVIASKGWVMFLLGGILGAAVFLGVYGIETINPLNDSWLYVGGDLTQHHIGWLFYRKSEWQFPIGLIDGLVYPNKVSCMYIDCIPLLAIPFKILSPVLPETFQYVGIWGFMSFFLQGGFSVLIIKKFSNSMPFCLIASAFFCFSPIMFQRYLGHDALAGHWVILAAILFWVYKDKLNTLAKKVLAWGGLACIAVLVHMYYLPMVFGLMVGWLIADLLETKKIVPQLITGASSVVLALGVMYVLGAFYGNLDTNAYGFGVYSMNMNSYVNSMGLTRYLNELPVMDGQKFEGYAYLGLGVIIILFYAITLFVTRAFDNKNYGVRYYKEMFKRHSKRIVPLIVVLFIITLVALSNKITLNQHVLLDIKLPDFVMSILGTFRASSRFSWVLYYFIFIFGIWAVKRGSSKQGSATVILAICLAVQLVDLSPWIKYTSEGNPVGTVVEEKLESQEWGELASKSEHIVFAPVGANYLSKIDMYYSFAMYAIKYDLTINVFYLGRSNFQGFVDYADEQLELLNDGKSDGKTIYVLQDDYVPENPDLKDKIEEIDGYKVILG